MLKSLLFITALTASSLALAAPALALASGQSAFAQTLQEQTMDAVSSVAGSDTMLIDPDTIVASQITDAQKGTSTSNEDLSKPDDTVNNPMASKPISKEQSQGMIRSINQEDKIAMDPDALAAENAAKNASE